MQQPHSSENTQSPVWVGQEGSTPMPMHWDCTGHSWPAWQEHTVTQHRKGLAGAPVRAPVHPKVAPARAPIAPEPMEFRQWLLNVKHQLMHTTHQSPVLCLSGTGGIIPTDQGMPPSSYSPTISPNITRSRCSSTRKMLLERKFTLSRDTKAEKALSENPSLIWDFLS